MGFKYNIHTYLFSQRLDMDLEEILDKAKRFGYDGIEVPFNLEEYVPRDKLPQELKKRGLSATACAGLKKDSDIISENASERERGIEEIKRYIDYSHEINSPFIGGVLSSSWGRLSGFAPTQEEWKRSVEALQIAAEYAKEAGIKIGIEPVNRYESHFITTTAQGKQLIEHVGSPWVGLLLDTYHMNVEEKDLASAIRLAGNDLIHLHACENDRGIPGSGHIDWKGIFYALKDIDYSGQITIESFVLEMESIARETAIWRKVAPSADELAIEGLKYLKQMESFVFTELK